MKKIILSTIFISFSLLLKAADRYWVGVNASWDGTPNLKWSTTSGGVGGASEPTSSDNVFFDANSGTGAVTVMTTTVKCLNLNFAGFSGTFVGGAGAEVWIYGNLTLSATMTFAYNYNIRFKATSGFHSITSNGIEFGCSVYFDGNGGNWELIDDMILNNSAQTLELVRGTFNTNNRNITCGRFISSNSNIRSLIMGTGMWTLTGSGSNVWDFSDTTNLNFNCGTSTIKITGVAGSDCFFVTGSQVYYNIWTTLLGYYTLFIGGIPQMNNLIAEPGSWLQFSPGAFYTLHSATLIGTASNKIIMTANGSSDWNIVKAGGGIVSCDYLQLDHSQASPSLTWYAGSHSTDNGGNTGWIFSSLPLKLLKFTGIINEQKNILLSWTTSNEINTSHFNIQRSYDGKEFVAVANIYSKSTNDNIKNYTYEDNKYSLNKAKIYYRLQMFDKDGSFTYSSIKSVNIVNKTQTISIYPNPVKGNNFTIDIGNEVVKLIGYKITTIEGKKVMQGNVVSRQQTINLTHLNKGTYIIKLDNGIQEKFIKD